MPLSKSDILGLGSENYGSAPLQSLASMPAPVAQSLSALASSASSGVIRNGGGFSVLSSLSSSRSEDSPTTNTPRTVPGPSAPRPQPAQTQSIMSRLPERKESKEPTTVSKTSPEPIRMSVKRPLVFDESFTASARRGFRLPDEARYYTAPADVSRESDSSNLQL